MNDIDAFLAESGVKDIAPAGYHIALRVGFAFPKFEMNTLPRAWISAYTQSGYMLHDPIIQWVYDHVGAARWSDLAQTDSQGVFHAAREYGLHHGAVVSIRDEDDPGIRSFASFARSDRDVTAGELASLEDLLVELHARAKPPHSLTEAELATLRFLASGLLAKEIAHELRISESAVKQRLASAKVKTKSRTTTQAVIQATRLGWI